MQKEIEQFLAKLSRTEKAEVLQWVTRDLGESLPGIDTKVNPVEAEVGVHSISVWWLVREKKLGATEEQLLRRHHGLLAEDLVKAWDYYHSHREEIDRQIEQYEAKQELFEKFGKQLIERVRDYEIHLIEGFLDQTAPASTKYKAELDGLSPDQREMLKKETVQCIDGTIHDFLFLLESADWIKLRLDGKEVVLEDIRRATSGDLQGYIFDWAEKYSKKRIWWSGVE